MKVEVVNLSPTQQRVSVEVPAADVKARIDRAYKALSKQAKIKGFRPGKIPMDVIKRMYGKSVMRDVAEDIVQATAMKAMQDVDARPASPLFIEHTDMQPGAEYQYGILFEVFQIPDEVVVEPLTYAPAPGAPTEDQLLEVLERIRDERGELVPVEDRGAEIGDQITIDAQGTVDGEAVEWLTGDSLRLTLGNTDLLKGITEGLLGAKPSEERDVEVTIPENAEEHAGKTALIHVAVTALHAVEKADIDDELAKDLEFESLQQWKDSVRDELAAKQAAGQASRRFDDMMSQLIEMNPFEVPHTPAHELAEAMAQRMFQIPKPKEQPRLVHMLEPMAVKQIKEQILFEKLSELWALAPSDEELRALVMAENGLADDAAYDTWVKASGERAETVQGAIKRTLIRERIEAKLLEGARERTAEEEAERAARAEAAAQTDDDHSGHDHSGHDHSGHDHSGHEHCGHDHSGHDHSGQEQVGQAHSGGEHMHESATPDATGAPVAEPMEASE